MDFDANVLSGLLLASRPPSSIVAVRPDDENGRQFSWQDFSAAVGGLAQRLAQSKERRWALFHSDSYCFATGLFALLHSGKQVLLPINAQSGTVRELAGEVDALLGEFEHDAGLPHLSIEGTADSQHRVSNALGVDCELTLMTSGSTGGAKRVRKTLKQLGAELLCLERLWGPRLGSATVLATVSHQHIYGLLFRVLWPLCAGRVFVASTYAYPEPLFRDMKRWPCVVLVSSPAQLKRLPASLIPADAPTRIAAIFSSGGPLPLDTALSLNTIFPGNPIEIFGSTETGGVGWRVQAQSGHWTALPAVYLRLQTDDVLGVQSPFTDYEVIAMGDRARLLPGSGFELLGRADQIVKVEEKRISLNELDARLREHPLVADARTVLLPGARIALGAALELNDKGLEFLRRVGKRELNEALRQHLLQFFERVLLPRKWRYFTELPGNSQGKLTRETLLGLFAARAALPGKVIARSGAELLIAIDLAPDDPAFAGHFPSRPVLPGVTQLDWAIRHSQSHWYGQLPFAGVDQLKFQQIIAPGARITLRLTDRGAGQVEFSYREGERDLASGRLRFGAGHG